MDESLKSLSDPRVLDGGTDVAFTVERHDGEKLGIVCATQEIADIIAFFAGLAMHASSDVARDVPIVGSTSECARIPCYGIAFAHVPNETLLTVDLGSCRLGFPISNGDLLRLADEMPQIARTLAADLSKKN